MGFVITLKDGSVVETVPENYTGFCLNTDHNERLYYLRGLLHSSVVPALVLNDDRSFWYLNGHFHRSNGSAEEPDENYWIESWYLTSETKIVLVSLVA